VTGRRPAVVALGAVDPTLVTEILGDSIEFVAQPGPEDLAIAEGAIARADGRRPSALANPDWKPAGPATTEEA
jgi:hypothetical protein